MNGTSKLPISPIGLNDVLQAEYRAMVVRRALEFRKQSASIARHRFDTALRSYIDVADLDTQVAIAPTMFARLIDACQHDATLFQEVLVIWQQSHQPLGRRMREFLRASGLATVEPEQVREGFLGTWPQDDLIALANRFHAQHPSFNRDDEALMLCCAYGRLPATPATLAPEALVAFDQIDAANGTRWQVWIDEIHALPLDAPEWDAPLARAFAHAVVQVAEQREQARAAIRARLQTMLAALREQAHDTLAYFGFSGVEQWSDSGFALAMIEPLADDVARFAAMLQAHRSSLQQAPALTRAEQRQRQQTLDALEAAIEQAYAQLDARFTHAPPLAEPGPEPLRERVVGEPTHDAPPLSEHIGDSAAPMRPGPDVHALAVAPMRRQGIFRRRAV